MRAATAAAGLPLGDRFCLALAMAKHATAITADRAWGELDIGCTVDVIR